MNLKRGSLPTRFKSRGLSTVLDSFEFSFGFLFLAVVSTAIRPGGCQLVRLRDGGQLKGTAIKTLGGREVYSFLKIPYAVPPLGDLRFKSPVPSAPWSGVLDCTRDAPICTQRNPYVRDEHVSGQEDCLYVSVHTPKLPEKEPSPLLPVMVFLHGGGFMCGAGVSAFYGPQHLLDRDVILVGVNYRLGPLGFLSSGDLNCPGNNGLKDQSLALRWVRDNIASFGGDPALVTLFGESAGGASVDYHMISNSSRELFHRAISQSGTQLCPWAAPPSPEVPPQRALRLARLLRCPSSGQWPETLDCLRQRPAEEVTNAFYEFYEWDTDPMIAFPPVVEPAHEGAFLSEHPRVVLRSPEGPWGAKLPWMTGVTSDEGALKTAAIFGLPKLADELDTEWNRIAPILLQYKGAPGEQEISDQIRQYYLKDKKINQETRRNVTDLMSDHWFLSGMHESLQLRRQLHHRLRQEKDQPEIGETYAYLFSYRGTASFTSIFGDPHQDYGVCHADELQYLFPVGKDLFPGTELSEEDKQMVRTLTELWTNFARDGRPSLDSPSGAQSPWLPVSSGAPSSPLDYYVIAGGARGGDMRRGLWGQRADFWLRLPLPLNQLGRDVTRGQRDEL